MTNILVKKILNTFILKVSCAFLQKICAPALWQLAQQNFVLLLSRSGVGSRSHDC